jgi:hypothetical protein
MEEDPMPYGYNGKILHVDLTKGELTVEEPNEAFYRKYLGGSAMGMYYILREMPKGADPLRPENVLTLMESPECECQIPDQRWDWRFTKRRLFPCRVEICRF